MKSKYLPWVLLCTLVSGFAGEKLTLGWTNNMLRISGSQVPGEYVEIWYLEAFCRSGSTHRKWEQTTIPHRTELISATPQRVRLRTKVEPAVILEHEITASEDAVDFKVTARNDGTEYNDVQWFQPCMRVDRFTGAKQTNYIEQSFIFTEAGAKLLSELPRNEEGIYRGGQVYVPAGVPPEDVNPRPISDIRPANDLIGCYSKDGKKILATAWDSTQELFQGVIVCLHNDPRIGGLKPGGSKALKGKVYILENDLEELRRRYRAEFGR
jgi:hypothetical protein